jgi:hypothetical protein
MHDHTMKFVRVKSQSLSDLYPMLRKYLQLNMLIAHEWQWKDVPWRFNERPNLSLLAAATWKTGGIAFEEYATKKRHHSNRLNRPTIYRGRKDLYLKIGSREFDLEAKNLKINGFLDPQKSRGQIVKRFNQAIHDAEKNKSDGRRRLAALFVAPRFVLKDTEFHDRHIRDWLKALSKIHYSTCAWIFPSRARRSPLRNKTRNYPGHVYPGVVLLLKIIT